MEYFPYGDLGSCIDGPVPEPESQAIARQILEGLQLVHDCGITHRDLKPQNIFVVQKSPDWWIKIGDFGISKRIGENTTSLHTEVGTAKYMAPEILDEDNFTYTNAVDMWAFGCVIYLLLGWTMPFPHRRCVQRYAKDSTQISFQPLVDNGVTSTAIMFVQSLLSVSPRDRPSAQDALQLPWMMNDASISLHASSITTLTEPMPNPLPTRGTPIQVAPVNRPKIPEDIEGTIRASSSLNSQTAISSPTSMLNEPDMKGQSARMYITSDP